jgi:hypothetical protein
LHGECRKTIYAVPRPPACETHTPPSRDPIMTPIPEFNSLATSLSFLVNICLIQIGSFWSPSSIRSIFKYVSAYI